LHPPAPLSQHNEQLELGGRQVDPLAGNASQRAKSV
jgi:hypothetical protein